MILEGVIGLGLLWLGFGPFMRRAIENGGGNMFLLGIISSGWGGVFLVDAIARYGATK